MTNTLEQNRKIIADAPEYASHVLLQEDGEPVFFTTCKESGEFLFNTGFDWDCFGAFEQLDCLTQSLDDIRENIALQEEVLKYQKRVVELENELNLLRLVMTKPTNVSKSSTLEQAKLELKKVYSQQQIKGYELALSLLDELSDASSDNGCEKLKDEIQSLKSYSDFHNAEKQVRKNNHE